MRRDHYANSQKIHKLTDGYNDDRQFILCH